MVSRVKEHDFLIQRWYYTPHGVKMATIATLSAIIILPSIMMLVVNCQTASATRVFGEGVPRRVIVVAEGGNARRASPNTLSAFAHALNHTQWIKTDVIHTNGTYVILGHSKHHLSVTADGRLRDDRCTAAAAKNTSLTLRDTLAFAAAHNATFIIEYHPCSGDNITAAIRDMEAIARSTPGLVPRQTWYMYSEKDDIEPLVDTNVLTRDRIMYKQPVYRSLWNPFDAYDCLGGAPQAPRACIQANVPMSVELMAYDTWTCARHARVYNETWIHLVNIGPNLVRALEYSAARSVQSPDPETVVRVARERGVL